MTVSRIGIDAAGVITTLAVDAKHRWIDHVAIGPGGAVAWSAGKQACVRAPKGRNETGVWWRRHDEYDKR